MVTRIIFKNHLSEVGLTQNRETMALRTLTTIDLFYFIVVWGPTRIEIHWNSIWLRDRSHMTSHYTRGSVTKLDDFEGVLGRPLDTLFWALTISWSRLLARVWRGPQSLHLSANCGLCPGQSWGHIDKHLSLQQFNALNIIHQKPQQLMLQTTKLQISLKGCLFQSHWYS